MAVLTTVLLTSKVLATLWATSAKVYARPAPATVVKRLGFTWRGWLLRHHVRELLSQSPASPSSGGAKFSSLPAARSRVLGVLAWPYLNASWSPMQRLRALTQHYRLLPKFRGFVVDPQEAKLLCDLNAYHPGARLVLERPPWFEREGQLTLTLAVEDRRAYCLAFDLAWLEPAGQTMAAEMHHTTPLKSQVGLRVGAIQGRSAEWAHPLYKALTKAMAGVRPRDLMVSSLQLLAQQHGITRIVAVDDEHRHHRHSYFGHYSEQLASANYNEIWRDRGGQPAPGGFFELPAELAARDPATVSSSKRAMYRRREQMYDDMAQQLTQNLGRALKGQRSERNSHWQ